MNCKTFFLSLLCAGMLFSSVKAQNDSPLSQTRRSDGAVRLPVEGSVAASPDRSVALRVPLPEGMEALVDPSTGMIHRAFGRPVRITGYDAIDDDNVGDAAAAFLQQYRASIGIDPQQLRLRHITRVGNRWYVSWQQIHDGTPVLLSEVELRLFANGNVTAFGANVFPDLRLDDGPSISAADAWTAAAEGLQTEPSLRKTALPETAILPIKRPGAVRYHLVYPCPVQERDGRRWKSYVDAVSGDLLWRYAQSYDAGSEITAHGGVTLVHPNEAEMTDVTFADMYISVDGQQHITDENGELTAQITVQSDIEASFRGPWCTVHLADREDGAYTGTLQPGQPLDLTWDDQNSHRFERILFYHTNLNRRYLKSIDTAFSTLDIPVKVEVEFDGDNANAYSAGDEIHFLAAGNESMRMAAAPMVLYHELGHSVNTLLYAQLGVEGGMQNRTCHEGMADLHASMITDYPRMGTGVFADDETRVMRDLENEKTYPESITGESHHDGQILSGAFWDLRKSTSLDLVRTLSHFAKYGLPDDPNDAVAFNEWFLETLIADDDDGDLSNGTPHAEEIMAAFARHHIGAGLFMKMHFRHIPLANTADTLQPYPVRFILQKLALPGGDVSDPHVLYRINNGPMEYRADAQFAGQGEFEALIPPQPRGTLVSYVVAVNDGMSKNEVRFTPDLLGKDDWCFLVGFDLFFVDACEEDRGWMIGDDEDNASSGVWERGTPELIELGSAEYLHLIQPAEDHSDFGQDCYVTGVRGGSNFFMYLPDGRTTLTSPVMDMRDIRNPILEFWYFFTTRRNPYFPETPEGKLIVQLSSDGGAEWTTAFETSDEVAAFKRRQLRIEDVVDLTDAMHIRFILDTPASSEMGIPVVLSNALVDDITIFAVMDGTPTPVEQPGRTPEAISLGASYPNPMHDVGTISFRLDAAQPVLLRITDMLGRHVSTLVDSWQTAGRHSVRWNGRGADGRHVPAGNYYIHLSSSREVMTRRIVVR